MFIGVTLGGPSPVPTVVDLNIMAATDAGTEPATARRKRVIPVTRIAGFVNAPETIQTPTPRCVPATTRD